MRPLGGTQSGQRKRLEHDAEHDHAGQHSRCARPFRRTIFSGGIQVLWMQGERCLQTVSIRFSGVFAMYAAKGKTD